MKIGSLNIRGLGSEAKKDEVAALFFNLNLDFLCLQETKLETFSDQDGIRIWKSRDIKWCAEGAIGRSGGILTCWNGNKFTCISSWSLGGAVVVNGWWIATRNDCCIINVYAQCNRQDKRMLWDRINVSIAQSPGISICIIGDFNSILHVDERAGSSDSSSSRDITIFKNFITSNRLIDVVLQGRKFTWYKSNGSCKSRINRALVNDKWAETWNNTGLRGLPRSISDHCAIVLQSIQTDWGPKPFRFINAWLSHPHFIETVANSWNKDGIVGWGSYVFKEKLKRLKDDLKWWNISHFGIIDQKIASLREEVSRLDAKDDVVGLSLTEALARSETSANLILQLNKKRILLAQKARLRWLKDSDVNSKFFHKAINRRIILNGLAGVDDDWCEEPARIKDEVTKFFMFSFSINRESLVQIPDDLFTSRLSDDDGALLTRNFSEEEIKQAV